MSLFEQEALKHYNHTVTQKQMLTSAEKFLKLDDEVGLKKNYNVYSQKLGVKNFSLEWLGVFAKSWNKEKIREILEKIFFKVWFLFAIFIKH